MSKKMVGKTKLKILTPTGVTIKDLDMELDEYNPDFRIIIEHEEYSVLYVKEIFTINQNKDEDNNI